jgi:hypothetical protein
MAVKRRQKLTSEDLNVLGRAFIETDDTAKMFGNRAGKLKADLMKILEAGQPDEDGHVWSDPLDEPVLSRTTASNGKVREETVVGFKREKRKSRYVDSEKVEAWAKKHKVWDEVTEEVVTREVVEDKLWLLVMEGRFSEEEIEDLYAENVTYALTRVVE